MTFTQRTFYGTNLKLDPEWNCIGFYGWIEKLKLKHLKNWNWNIWKIEIDKLELKIDLQLKIPDQS